MMTVESQELSEQQHWTELPQWQQLQQWWQQQNQQHLVQLHTELQHQLRENGATFDPWLEQQRQLDLMPWLVSDKEWQELQTGVKQRQLLLSMVLQDLYGPQLLIQQGLLPAELIFQNKDYLLPCHQLVPSHQQWLSLLAVDLGRDAEGKFCVYADQSQMPAGLGFVLEHRLAFNHCIGELNHSIGKSQLAGFFRKLQLVFAQGTGHTAEGRRPLCGLLTHGKRDAAYFEHAFLAQQMGAELVEGNDLVVQDECVFMKTVSGLERVDVIYRRIDDLFLDPEAFDPKSVLGVPGLMRAWRAGNVALANAPGAGVADDKVVYAYVPDIIRYYLDQEPIVPNVETFLCCDDKQREYVLANLDKLVVKPANESGGYGMLIGPHSTKKERAEFAELIKAKPRNYIAQPTLALSTAPTLVGNSLEPRHLDLRPFILQSSDVYVTTGGLTRVAMRKGSLVVNSSQGGGSKDTWIVDTEVNS